MEKFFSVVTPVVRCNPSARLWGLKSVILFVETTHGSRVIAEYHYTNEIDELL
jgi:hypothetical protein